MPWVSDSSVTYWLNLLPDLQSYFIALCIAGNILWVSACVSLKFQYLLLKWNSQVHIFHICSVNLLAFLKIIAYLTSLYVTKAKLYYQKMLYDQNYKGVYVKKIWQETHEMILG